VEPDPTASPPSATTAPVRAHDAWVSALLLVCFLCLYVRSIDLSSPNAFSHNFVFDADLDRVVADAATRQSEVAFGRHPLFALVLAFPASLLARLGLAPASALRIVVASVAGLGVVAAYRVFRRITGEIWTALAFTLLYGLGSTVWLLSSVPETFAVNAAIITACFAFVGSGLGARPGSLRRLGFVLLSAVAVGVTVSNAAYVALAYLVDLRRRRASLRSRAGSLAAHAASTAGAFVALSLLQKAFFTSRIATGTGLVNPLGAASGDVFLSFERTVSLADVGRLLRAFTVDNLVAPGCVVEVVDSITGPNQMLQFGRWTSPAYLAGTLALGLLLVVPAARCSLGRVARSPRVELSLLYVAFNLGLHFFYRANGQPFIFTIHTALPVLVLLAEVHAASTVAFRRVLTCAAALIVAASNTLFVSDVRQALALGCARRVGPVCIAWKDAGEDPRWRRGLDAYLGSALGLAALGDEAFEHARYEEAVRSYEAALARDPSITPVEGNLAIALTQIGRHADAAVHFRRASAGAAMAGARP